MPIKEEEVKEEVRQAPTLKQLLKLKPKTILFLGPDGAVPPELLLRRETGHTLAAVFVMPMTAAFEAT
jgi:hypothetical protein